jgi:hypothetical protein
LNFCLLYGICPNIIFSTSLCVFFFISNLWICVLIVFHFYSAKKFHFLGKSQLGHHCFWSELENSGDKSWTGQNY